MFQERGAIDPVWGERVTEKARQRRGARHAMAASTPWTAITTATDPQNTWRVRIRFHAESNRPRGPITIAINAAGASNERSSGFGHNLWNKMTDFDIEEPAYTRIPTLLIFNETTRAAGKVDTARRHAPRDHGAGAGRAETASPGGVASSRSNSLTMSKSSTASHARFRFARVVG